MGKKLYVCDICQLQVKDLAGHKRRRHGEDKPEPNAGTKGKKLELEVKTVETDKTEQTQGYHCVDCGAGLSKGQTPCPSCGKTLDWSQV